MRGRTHSVSGLFDELIVDNFAGGGGASLGIERGIGRAIDIAINHDAEAVALHRRNHPHTLHYCEDVWEIDPIEATAGRPVGLAWFSPDCKHFSKAKGGRPVSKRVRGLAWVVLRWAAKVRPRVIILENVEEFTTWGPLGADGRPCPKRRGRTFRSWVGQLRDFGYDVQWHELRACDYGAPTIRRRLFLVARCDGQPIVWPKPTHGEGLKRYRTAADCIDWSLPCPSIFDRKRPLAENTLRRIARGVQRYVIEAAEPFIVTCNHGGPEFRGHSVTEPMRTLTASRDAHGLVMPYFIPRHGENSKQKPRCRSVDAPLPTVTATANGATLVSAFLAVDETMPTITAGGNHVGEVRAFLIKYYGQGCGQSVREPAHTVTTKDRLGLVTVRGQDYQIADIGMRMLQPRELFRAQGFPDQYAIDHGIDAEGNRVPLSKVAQVRLCGNSVCPDLAEALVRANCQVPAARAAEVLEAQR